MAVVDILLSTRSCWHITGSFSLLHACRSVFCTLEHASQQLAVFLVVALCWMLKVQRTPQTAGNGDTPQPSSYAVVSGCLVIGRVIGRVRHVVAWCHIIVSGSCAHPSSGWFAACSASVEMVQAVWLSAVWLGWLSLSVQQQCRWGMVLAMGLTS